MKRFVFGCLLLSVCFVSNGQIESLQSQYMFNPLVLNPAYAGYHEMAMFVATQRFQWAGIDGAPKNSLISAHTPLPLDKMGVGVNISRESFGVNKNYDVQMMTSYKIAFADKKLSMGVSGSYSSINLGINELYDANGQIELDPSAPDAQISVSKPNFGFGAMFSTNKYFAGVSIPKILSVNGTFGEDQSATIYLRHYYVSGGLILKIMNGTVFKPSIMIKAVQNSPTNYDINGSLLVRDNIWLGLSLRSSATTIWDAVVPNTVVVMTQIQVNDFLKVGYASDIPVEGDLYRAAEPIQIPVLGRLLVTHELFVNLNMAIFGNQAVQTIYF
jgi:type IX secretion system PorP/SprF family membrane protein